MAVVASHPVANSPAVKLCENASSGGASDLSTTSFVLKNMTRTATVWLGPSTVTDSGGTKGFAWEVGDMPLSIDLEPGESLYGYTTTPQTIDVLKAGR